MDAVRRKMLLYLSRIEPWSSGPWLFSMLTDVAMRSTRYTTLILQMAVVIPCSIVNVIDPSGYMK
jgi:hypothetical protein